VDEVTQFCVEEACFERATMLEHRAGATGLDEPELSPAERHAQAMAATR
jgi:hypothetical protein